MSFQYLISVVRKINVFASVNKSKSKVQLIYRMQIKLIIDRSIVLFLIDYFPYKWRQATSAIAWNCSVEKCSVLILRTLELLEYSYFVFNIVNMQKLLLLVVRILFYYLLILLHHHPEIPCLPLLCLNMLNCIGIIQL